MTQVNLTQDGNRYTVTATGHATGSVEMCAAISALLYALEGWLANSSVNVQEKRMDDADVRIVFVGGKSCETVFDMVTIGFLRLQETDRNRIKVDVKIIS